MSIILNFNKLNPKTSNYICFKTCLHKVIQNYPQKENIKHEK